MNPGRTTAALLVTAALTGCGGGSGGPDRADMVNGLADMFLTETPASDICAGLALVGGRDGLVSVVETTSTADELNDDLADLSAAEQAALDAHGVTVDDIRAAVADDSGKTTHDGAVLFADATVAACAKA